MPKRTEHPTAVARIQTAKELYKDHSYLNPDGSVDGERLLIVLNDTPGAFHLMILAAMIQEKDIAPEYLEIAHETVTHLATTIMLSGFGDENAAIQLRAVEKLLRPAKYELPLSKIKEIVDRYETSPPLARGWELRRLMSDLAGSVEPVRTDRPYSPDQPVRLLDKPRSAYDFNYWHLAKENWKPNSTLQSLAIRIYLKHLQDQGVTEGETINERTLKRDLAKVRAWEATADEQAKRQRGSWTGRSPGGGLGISWCEFSEGWKKRKKKAQGKPMTKRLTS